MAKQSINIGSVPNDGTGNTLRDAGDLINDNFNEIYTAIGDGTTLTAGTFVTTTNTVSITNKTFDTTNTFPTITIGDDTSTNFAISLGGSFEIVGGSGITTAIENNRIVLSTDGSIVTETSSDTLTNKTINAPDNTITNLSNSNLSGSAGITNANLSTSYITIGDDTSTNFNVDLGGSFEIVGGSGINTAIENNRIVLSTDGSIVTETSSDVLTNKTINGPDNTLTNIANASLSNSSITLGATAINLGDTAGSATTFNLSGTSSISGSGTVNTTGSGNRLRFNVAYADATALASGINPTTYEGAFVYNTTENYPYVADPAGWTRIITENDSIGDLSNVTIAGIADTNVLAWNSSNGRFEPAAAAGASFTTDKSNTGDG